MARTCPVCGERFDDSDGNIYCPKCGSIADESVRLSERIQKQVLVKEPRPVQKEAEEEPKKVPLKAEDSDIDVKRLSEGESSHTSAIVVCVLLVLAALAFYFFFMA